MNLWQSAKLAVDLELVTINIKRTDLIKISADERVCKENIGAVNKY